MPTVKLVVIGASGVGKTSLRGQYISGRFSSGYRATIGADFITKTLPHPHKSDELVTLQIWDTAGQERFSSLSTAFFRGADAAILMFDVNAPETLEALQKWWDEFRTSAPLADEDVENFCNVIVGNKIDKVGNGTDIEAPITEAQAMNFMRTLIPISSLPPSPLDNDPFVNNSPVIPSETLNEESVNFSRPTAQPQAQVEFPRSQSRSPSPDLLPLPQTRSDSIAINHPTRAYSPRRNFDNSRSRSSSHLNNGTTTSNKSSLSLYHTPSSSLFDVFHSARSSPEPRLDLFTPSTASNRLRRMTTLSTGSTSTGSGVTITPSLFAREHAAGTISDTVLTTPDGENQPLSASTPVLLTPPLERGPKLFFTSAKTGEGVSNVFEYIARRVVTRWDYEEQIEARRMHFRETSTADTIRLGLGGSRRSTKKWGECCGS